MGWYAREVLAGKRKHKKREGEAEEEEGEGVETPLDLLELFVRVCVCMCVCCVCVCGRDGKKNELFSLHTHAYTYTLINTHNINPLQRTRIRSYTQQTQRTLRLVKHTLTIHWEVVCGWKEEEGEVLGEGEGEVLAFAVENE